MGLGSSFLLEMLDECHDFGVVALVHFLVHQHAIALHQQGVLSLQLHHSLLLLLLHTSHGSRTVVTVHAVVVAHGSHTGRSAVEEPIHLLLVLLNEGTKVERKIGNCCRFLGPNRLFLIPTSLFRESGGSISF